jgi:hypothetical protein
MNVGKILYEINKSHIGFEVLAAVVMKISSVFWDIMLCLPPASCRFLAWLILQP